jgi:hypothetical protein
MTELEKQIDQQVGNDTEHERTTYLKFIQLGRQLESEARIANGEFSADDLKKAKLDVFAAIEAIEAEAGKVAEEIEKVDEDAVWANTPSMPEGLVSREAVQNLLDNVDAKHTANLKVKAEKLKALKESL